MFWTELATGRISNKHKQCRPLIQDNYTYDLAYFYKMRIENQFTKMY